MIQRARGESEAGAHIVRFEIRKLLEDLFPAQSCSEKVEHITHANPHPPYAGTPTTLLRVNRNSIRHRFSSLIRSFDALLAIVSRYSRTQLPASDESLSHRFIGKALVAFPLFSQQLVVDVFPQFPMNVEIDENGDLLPLMVGDKLNAFHDFSWLNETPGALDVLPAPKVCRGMHTGPNDTLRLSMHGLRFWPGYGAIVLLSAMTPAASAAAFRLEVTLPAGAAKALEQIGRSLSLAIETELVENVDVRQTPLSQPKANLRSTERDGTAETRMTKITLRPELPPELEAELRHQSGSTRYVSPWIIALGDIRASEHYVWKFPAGVTTDAQKRAYKESQGCFSCERPAHLRGKTEADGVYELITPGDHIAIRPDGALASSVLAGTPYAYLGENGRLTARFTTIRARKVRPTDVLVAAHNPPVADGMLQETHYLHSVRKRGSGLCFLVLRIPLHIT
jgi:hypothetical protein